MDSVQIVLGERTHMVTPLKSRKAELWRNKVDMPVEQIQTLLANVDNIDLSDPASLSVLLSMVSQYVIGSPTLINNLVIEYAQLSDEIKDEAYDHEFVVAFVEILKLAYPFGPLLTMFPGLQSRLTSKNLPSQNGVSGQTTTLISEPSAT